MITTNIPVAFGVLGKVLDTEQFGLSPFTLRLRAVDNAGLAATSSTFVTNAPPPTSGTKYVSLAGIHQYPFTNWSLAANDIQSAVDVCVSGDTVIVAEGVYRISTSLIVTNAVTIVSSNGYAGTIIDGSNYCRLAYLSNPEAVFKGFTVSNGNAVGALPDSNGGGFYVDGGGRVENCVLVTV